MRYKLLFGGPWLKHSHVGSVLGDTHDFPLSKILKILETFRSALRGFSIILIEWRNKYLLWL